jgi:hypothetical protein
MRKVAGEPKESPGWKIPGQLPISTDLDFVSQSHRFETLKRKFSTLLKPIFEILYTSPPTF